MEKFSELQEATDALVNNSFINIRPECTSLPELESKLQSTLSEIKAINDKDLADSLKNLTKKPTPLTTKSHKPRNKKNISSPSKSEGIKTLIRQVIGEIFSPYLPYPLTGLPVEEDGVSMAAIGAMEEDHN